MRLSTSGSIPRFDHSLLVDALVPLREEWAALRFDAAGDVVNPVTGASLDVLRLRLNLAGEMQIPSLQEALNRMVFQSPWDGPAAKALSRQLDVHLGKMVLAVQGDDVAGMIHRQGLDFVRSQAAANLESGVTIPGIVMLDQHLRRLL